MPRGRPRKNPLPTESTAAVKHTPPTAVDTKDKEKDKEKSSHSICDRCHKPHDFTERKLNLSLLTGMASWHRDVMVDKVSLCYDCSKELNKLIDDWLINKGKGVTSKYNKEV